MADEVIEFAKVRNSSRVEVFSFFALLMVEKLNEYAIFSVGYLSHRPLLLLS